MIRQQMPMGVRVARKDEQMIHMRRGALLSLFLAVMMLVPGAAFAGEDSDTGTATGSLSQETTDTTPTDGADDGDTEVDTQDTKDGDTEDGDTKDETDDDDTDGSDDESDRPDPVTVTDVTSTLPVLGAGLTVSITIGEDGVSEVAFDPAAGEVVKSNDHKVKFEMEDGETTVVVHAGKRGARTTVRTNSLDNVSGPGVWSADVFGNGVVTVAYDVGADADGAPLLTVGDVTAPDGVTVEVTDRTKVGDSSKRSGAMVRLTSGDQTATVWLKVAVHTLEDGTERASLSVGIWPGRRQHLADDHPGNRRGHDGERDQVRDRDGDRDEDRDRRGGEGRGNGDGRGNGNGRGRA